MRCAAGLHPDHSWWQLGKEQNHFLASKPLAQHRLFIRINPMQLKNMLRRIHANSDNLLHGRLPRLRPLTSSFWHIRCRRGPSTPSTTCAFFAGWGRSSAYDCDRWLWVPAFAGTTRPGDAFPSPSQLSGIGKRERRHPAGGLVEDERARDRRFGALAAVLALAQPAIDADRRAFRLLQIDAAGIDQARGMTDL